MRNKVQTALQKYLLPLIFLEGVLAIVFYINIPSSDKNIIFAGLSKDRLIIGAGFLSLLLIVLFFWLWTKHTTKGLTFQERNVKRVFSNENFIFLLRIFLLVAIAIPLSLWIFISPFFEFSNIPAMLPLLYGKVLPLVIWFIVVSCQCLFLLARLEPKRPWYDSALLGAGILLNVFFLLYYMLHINQRFLMQNIAWEYQRLQLPLKNYVLLFVWLILWIVFLLLLSTKKLSKPWTSILPFALFVAGMFILPYSEGNIIASRSTNYLNEPQNHVIYSVCHENHGIVETIIHYDEFLIGDFWLGTKPPGYFTFYSLVQTAGKSIFKSATSCDQAVSWLGSILFPLFAGLNIFLITALGKKYEFQNSYKAGILFIVLPNVLFFPFAADQFLFPLVFNSILLLVLDPPNRLIAILAGIVLYFGLFISFSLLPILGIIGVWYLLKMIREPGRVKEIILNDIVFIAVGFLSSFILMLILFGYNPIIRYQIAFQNHRTHKAFTGNFLTTLKTILLNNFEFAIFIGLLNYLFFISEGIRSGITWLKKTNSKADTFILSTFFAFLGLNVLGQTRGEVGRLWIFFCPLVALVVLHAINKYDKQKKILYFLFIIFQLLGALTFYLTGFRYFA